MAAQTLAQDSGLSDFTHVLFVAGYGNSGPGHWQRLWHEAMPGSVWVEQSNWETPIREEWVAALDAHVERCSRPVQLIAHSLGCLAVVAWSERHRHAVAGAFLVAVPDPVAANFPPAIRGFSEPRQDRLPFASVVVASSDDPYISGDRSRELARRWGSTWIDVGARGHINASSGLGGWADGLALWQRLTV